MDFYCSLKIGMQSQTVVEISMCRFPENYDTLCFLVTNASISGSMKIRGRLQKYRWINEIFTLSSKPTSP